VGKDARHYSTLAQLCIPLLPLSLVTIKREEGVSFTHVTMHANTQHRSTRTPSGYTIRPHQGDLGLESLSRPVCTPYSKHPGIRARAARTVRRVLFFGGPNQYNPLCLLCQPSGSDTRSYKFTCRWQRTPTTKVEDEAAGWRPAGVQEGRRRKNMIIIFILYKYSFKGLILSNHILIIHKTY
jgi:hypothetical protein